MKKYMIPQVEVMQAISANTIQVNSILNNDPINGGDAPVVGQAPRRSLTPGFSVKAL